MSERAGDILVADMLDAVERILGYTKDLSYEKFTADGKTIDAVLRNLSVLGEAANRTPEAVRNLAPTIEWDRIIRSRHIVVHDYFGVDYQIVWRIIEAHLPALRKDLRDLLGRLRSSSGPT